MLTLFARAFQMPELRKKILFTLLVIVVFRFGQNLPVPNVDVAALKTAVTADNDLLMFFGMFSGDGLAKLSVFALGIFPFATGIALADLLTAVVPRLAIVKRVAPDRFVQYARVLTVVAAAAQATVFVVVAADGRLVAGKELLYRHGVGPLVVMVVCMTAGAVLVMWLAELVTARGLGNGVMIMFTVQIVAVFPTQFGLVLKTQGGLAFTIMIVVVLVTLLGMLLAEPAERRVPVQWAKRMVGRRMFGGTSAYIPVPLITAGFEPAAFVTTTLYLLTLANMLWPSKTLEPYLQDGNPWRMVVLFGLIIFFTYFAAAVNFRSEEHTEKLARTGGFVPGIRPGRPTFQYLTYVLTRLTPVGALYLAVGALLPALAFALLAPGQSFPFGGTAIIIVLGQGLAIIKEINYEVSLRHYSAFLG